MTVYVASYQAVQRGMTQIFRKAARAATPFYPRVCTVVPSQGADESYGWMGDMPSVREWVGERRFKQLRSAGFTLVNKHWELSLEFQRTTIDDDRYGMIRPSLANMAVRARQHPDKLLFDLINAAGSSVCYDGQYFFDTDHAWGDSGTQSNLLTYAAATGTTPTAEEWRLSLEQAIVAMLGFKDDAGEYLMQPTAKPIGNLVAVVPLSQMGVATRALNQMFALETSGSVVAATSNVLLERPTLVPTPFYSVAASWDLYNTGGPIRPFVFQDREPLRFQTKGFEDIEFKEIKAMTEARYNVGYGEWACGVRTTFT